MATVCFCFFNLLKIITLYYLFLQVVVLKENGKGCHGDISFLVPKTGDVLV